MHHQNIEEDLQIFFCLSFARRADPDAILGFKQRLLDCHKVTRSMEVSGTFDLIVEAKVKNFADYHDNLASLTYPHATLLERREANFVCKRTSGREVPEQPAALWIRTQDGHRRIEVPDIQKITAEGDYMRLHVRSGSHLVHSTLKKMTKELHPDMFVRLHRSTLVRRDLVHGLVHENGGGLQD